MIVPQTYARARLLLGITTVGFFVLLCSALLWFRIPELWFVTDPNIDPLSIAAILFDLKTLGVVVACYIGLHLVFDFLGGYVLQRLYDRPYPDAEIFLLQWFRGVLLQGLFLLSGGLLVLLTARAVGPVLAPYAATLQMLLLMILMVIFQRPLSALVGSNRRNKAVEQLRLEEVLTELDKYGVARPRRVVAMDSSDPGFSGGVTGLPGRETIVVPSQWLAMLPTEVVALTLLRRIGQIRSGSRTRGILVALAFNALGFLLVTLVLRADLSLVSGVLNVALGFSLWAFLGLLTLPSVSRPGVIQGDIFAKNSGANLELLSQVIQDLDRLQDDEPARSATVETIFHPIPSVHSRLAALAAEGTGPVGAWQANRVALYLSWPAMSCLSRAVHCNCGRPQVWVLLPGD
jgi:hypothetical protein